MLFGLRSLARFLLGLLFLALIIVAVLALSLGRWLKGPITPKRALLALVSLIVLGGVGLWARSQLIEMGLIRLPEQPLIFPHSVHAGELRISCLFCHRGAANDAVAGFPSVEQCLFCHRLVGREKPGVKGLLAAEEAGQPLNWLRLNRLPDHAHFDHQAHFLTGVGCSVCHGAVEQMGQVQRVRSLEMGDCLSCHRQQGAPTNCSVCHY